MRGVLGRTRAGKRGRVAKKLKRGLTCETLCCVSVSFPSSRRRGGVEEEKEQQIKGET